MAKKKTPTRGASGRFKKGGRKRNPSAASAPANVARSSNPAPRSSNPAPAKMRGRARQGGHRNWGKVSGHQRRVNPTENPSPKKRPRRRNPEMGKAGKLALAGLVGIVAFVGGSAALGGLADKASPLMLGGGLALASGVGAFVAHKHSPPAAYALIGVGVGLGGTVVAAALRAPAKPAPQQQSMQLQGLQARALNAVEQNVGAYGYPDFDTAQFAPSADLGLYTS